MIPTYMFYSIVPTLCLKFIYVTHETYITRYILFCIVRSFLYNNLFALNMAKCLFVIFTMFAFIILFSHWSLLSISVKFLAEGWKHIIREYTESYNFLFEKIANFKKISPRLLNIHFWWVGVLCFLSLCISGLQGSH